MPRPKVKPQDRRRSVRACTSCKSSKMRCDSQSPCFTCVRRGRADSCVYSTRAARTSIHGAHASTTVPENLQSVEEPNSSVAMVADHAPTSEGGQPDQHPGPNASTASPRETWSDSPRSTQSRMLVSSKGEKLYVGAASSLSFLQFLRQVVGQYIGPSPFTDNEAIPYMLEITQRQQVGNTLPWSGDAADTQHKEDLIKCSFEVASGILCLYSEEEIWGYFRDFFLQRASPGITATSKAKRTNLAALCLAIAIGGQCRGSEPSDKHDSAVCFAKAQQIAFEGFLCDPSIDMVRLFLLMAFYMLGACHRNAACMYLGVAAKAASTLGLHRKEQYSMCTADEAVVRLKCWRSLRVLDTLVGSILGRVSSAVSMYPNVDDLNDFLTHSESTNTLALDSMYQLCLIMDGFQQRLSRGANPDFSLAEESLEALQKWTRSLPTELRSFSPKDTHHSPNYSGRGFPVGATHVACCYYFSVILITRPFLISHLLVQLHSRSLDDSRPAWIKTPTEEKRTAKLAQTCTESATYMAQLCAKAVDLNLLYDNMCIIKAWMFAAGLLLGFSLFVEEGKETTQPAIVDAFESCCAVLRRFARLSPQADHYHDILNNLADAISQYRQQLAETRRRSVGQYVHRIFTIAEEEEPLQLQSQEETQQGEHRGTGSGSGDGRTDLASGCSVDGLDLITAGEYGVNLASFWDELSADNQAYSMFLGPCDRIYAR